MFEACLGLLIFTVLFFLIVGGIAKLLFGDKQ